MFLSKKRKLLAISFIPVTLTAALLGWSRGRGLRPADTPSVALEGHRFPVQALAFVPDGSALASAAYHIYVQESAMEVAVWDVATGTRLARRTEEPGGLTSLAFAPGGKRLAAAHGRSLWLWETTQAHNKGRLCAQRAAVCALAFSVNGAILAWGDVAGAVVLGDATGNGPLTSCKEHGDPAFALAFAPDSKTLAGGGYDTTVRLWCVATGAELACLRGHASVVHAVAYTPDGRALASGDVAGVVKLWDPAQRTERATLETLGDWVAALAFSPDGKTLAVAVDRAIQLWDVATGKRVARLEGHAGKVKCLAFSPDGTRLASGSYDRMIRLWDVARYQARTP
jgi:WD40 repeat protein